MPDARKLIGLVVVAGALAAAGCGDGESNGGGGGASGSNPLSGHVNEDAVQNCVEQGNDEATCREIWTVR